VVFKEPEVRISKLYAPWDTTHFGPAMRAKYKLDDYSPHNRKAKEQPVVVFGCYGRGTKVDVMNHRGLCVIVWSGSDSTRLHEVPEFIAHLRANTHRVFHIAHSHWIQTDLAYWGIPYIDRVVFPVDLSGYKFEPKAGNGVYHYGTKQREWYYGTHLMKKLRTKWDKRGDMPDIHITAYNAYGKEELYELYKECFIGVRLTEHDNMALSCVELGLMGRRSIFNGNIPCAIHYGKYYTSYNPETRRQWVYQDESLMGKVGQMILEADREPSKALAEEMREFVHDTEDWLDTKFYE
jgi:hypothetical protein